MTRSRLAGAGAAALLGLVALVGCGDDGDDATRSFCAALRSAPTLESVVSGFTRVDDSELSRRLDRAVNAYANVERTAPDAVDEDVDTVVAVVDAVIESVRDNADDRQAAIEAVRTATAEHPDLDGAAAGIAAFASTECDLDLNPGLSDTATTDPADQTTTTASE